MDRVVIAGGSTAGMAAARTLREEGFEGVISIVDPERRDPYDRTSLSKGLILGQAQEAEISLLTPDQLQELQLEWHRGQLAAALDPSRRVLTVEDGSELAFDGLLIATGSSARRLVLGHTPRGVVQLRSLDDALALRSALAAARGLALIGGGFVGLEIAAAAASLGLKTTVIESAPAPLAQALGVQIGEAVAHRQRALGVEILTGQTIVGWLGGSELQGVQLASGRRVDADLAVVGIGAVPNTQWLAGTALAGGNGVQCDETLATEAPGVVAAGDIVRWKHPLAGRDVRIEHFEHAELSGAHAARRLLYGVDAGTYAPVPFVWSEQGPHTLHVAGFPAEGARLEITEGDLREGPFAVSYLRDNGRPIAALTLDLPKSFRRLRRELSS